MTEDPAPKKRKWKFSKKKQDSSAALPPNPKGALEKSWLDKRFDKYAYHISFGVGGLSVSALVTSLFWGEDGLPQNVYYLSIFIGATLAATLATWRGRQSERQLREFKRQIQDSRSESEIARLERQVARFEKAIDMATDQTSPDRRSSGFQILRQILSNWRKSFDHLVEENLTILQDISTAPFWRTEKKEEEILVELYGRNKCFYSKEIEDDDLKILFEITSEHKNNLAALSLWKEITNWRGKRWGGFVAPDGTYAICSPVADKHAYFFYVFFRMSLDNVIFLIIDDKDRVDISTPDEGVHPGKRANFAGSCFVQTPMNNANVDHVNFLDSHFFAINYLEKRGGVDCKMSCKGTIFDKANLINCYFGETDFKDASFIDTNISGSDFSQAKSLTPGQFEKAYWIIPGKPQFPEGYDIDLEKLMRRPQNWEEVKRRRKRR